MICGNVGVVVVVTVVTPAVVVVVVVVTDAVTVVNEAVVVTTPDALVVVLTSTGIGLGLTCWVRVTPVVLLPRSRATWLPEGRVNSLVTGVTIALITPSFRTLLTVPDASRTAAAVIWSPLAVACSVPKLLMVETFAPASIRMPVDTAVGLGVPAKLVPVTDELEMLDSTKSSLRISGTTPPLMMWIAVASATKLSALTLPTTRTPPVIVTGAAVLPLPICRPVADTPSKTPSPATSPRTIRPKLLVEPGGSMLLLSVSVPPTTPITDAAPVALPMESAGALP